MGVVTVADVLRHAEAFEKRLGGFYKRLSERTSRDGVRLLADYMSRHRLRIAGALDKLSPAQVRRICCAPLRYEPQAADRRSFEDVDLPADATAAQVLDAAIIFDECLIGLYRQVVRQPVDQEVKAVFESLIRMEERSQIELKKMKAMDYF